MKKIISIILTLTICYQTFSQARLGIKAGANISTANAKINSSGASWEEHIKDPVINYHIGVFKTYSLNNKFNLRPELLYSLKGFKSETVQSDVITTANFHYFNLPLLISYKPIEMLSFLAGPELGLLLRASAKRADREDWDKFTSSYKRSDFGLAIGMNYDLSPAMAVELRYSHGLTKLPQFKGLNEIYNRVLQLGIAYSLIR